MDATAGRKVVLVTGASSGIGAAIARQLTRDGYQVFGTGRKVVTSVVDGMSMLPLDVASDTSVRACVEAVLEAASRIDVLINNAGYLLAGAIEEVPLDQAKAEFETNFFGVVRMVKAVLPSMRARRSGHIVNMSSLAGMVPMPFWGFYNASKFAVEGYSETLRQELRPFGITVSMIEPGAIETPFYSVPPAPPMPEYSPWRDRALATMKKFERDAPGPEAVARVVSKVVGSPRPRLRNAVTRQAKLLPVLRRFLPAAVFESAARRVFHLDG